MIDIYDLYFESWQKISRLLVWLYELPEECIRTDPRWHNQPKYGDPVGQECHVKVAGLKLSQIQFRNNEREDHKREIIILLH